MSKTKVILIVIAALLLGMFLGRIGLSQTGNALKSVVEPGSMTSEASYIIFTDGTTVYAKNGTTGEIEFSNTNASQVINNAIGNGGRKVVVTGNITITNTILVKAYTLLDLSGANLTLAANANCNMINATGWDYKITGGILDGNGNQQSSGSCIMINGGSQRFWIGGGMRIINAKQFGIYLLGSGPLVTQDIGAGTIDGIDIEDSGSHGILAATWSADNEYTNLNLGGNGGDGIALSSSGASIISDSFIWNNGRYGIDLAGANFNLIETCRVDSNTNNGIMLEYGSSNNTVLGNKIFLNNGTGIEIYDTPGYGPTAQNKITGNTLVGNAGGTILIGDTNNDISSNTGYNTEQQSYSYLVYTDGTNTYAKNGTTGQIDFESTNASQVINNAIGNTSSYGTVVLKGNITITNTIILNKPLTFIFDILIFDRSLSGNGINITNHDDQVKVVGQAIWAFPAGSPYSPWNNAAICITGLSSSAFIEVGAITYWPQPQQGFGIELYAGPGGYVVDSTIQNTRVSYFSTNIYLHCNGTGWVNRNTFNNVFWSDGLNYNLKIYNNGEGIGGNTFVNCWSEPPNNATGYNIWLGSSGSPTYPYVEYNQFNTFVSYDMSGSQVEYYADSSVRGTTFIGGLIRYLTSEWQDYGVGTIVKGLSYIVTENSGNATVSNNDWIAHGLATTPTTVTLTPRSNATVWVNNRNATHFQVGVSSGTVTIDWYAEA